MDNETHEQSFGRRKIQKYIIEEMNMVLEKLKCFKDPG